MDEKTQGETTPEPAQQGIGLGDVIERMTRAVGIKPCAACNKRKAKLNKLQIIRRKGRA